MLAAYRTATQVDRRGAVLWQGEMIDEASRKMAESVAARGRAAGLRWVPTAADSSDGGDGPHDG
jgi:citrate lyase subunit beta/citryl-CoA lyase